MLTHLWKQFGSLAITLLVATVFVFSLVRLVPGDPVIARLGEDSYTPALYEATAKRLGLDRPLHLQLWEYLRGLMVLDLGTSFRDERPVAENILSQLPYTFHLTALSLLISMAIGLPAGILAAVKRNTWLDRSAMVLALLALCAPNFLLGLILILFFSGQLQWFPSFGTGDGSLLSTLHHAVLPALALGASAAGVQARMVRSSLIEAVGQDYVRTAKAKGLTNRAVLLKHALRNALSPVLTLIGVDLARLLTGTVIMETMFARRGVGKLLVDAIYFRDYPQVQGTLLVFVVFVVVANTLTDIAYSLLDPRVRYG